MAQGRSTKIISTMKRIRTSKLSIQNSLSHLLSLERLGLLDPLLDLRALLSPLLVLQYSPRRLVSEREDFFIDNLLFRVILTIKLIVVERPCDMGVWIPLYR